MLCYMAMDNEDNATKRTASIGNMREENSRSVFQRGDSDTEKVSRFFAGSSALLVASLTSGVLSFAWTVLMSRLLGPEGFGIAGPFMNLFWMLANALSFGIPQAMATFISYCQETDPDEAQRMMTRGTMLLFVIGVSFAAVASATTLAAGAAGSWSSLFSSLAWVMLIALIGRQMYMGMFAIMGGLQRMDILALCNIAYPFMMVGFSGLFVMAVQKWRPGDMEARIVAGAAGIATDATAQYGISVLVIHRAGVSAKSLFIWRGIAHGSGKLLSFGWAAAVATIAGSSLSFIPPVIISMMARGFETFGATQAQNALNAGFFSSGFTNALAPMLIVGMIFAIVPAISEADASGSRDLMQKYFNLALKYSLTVIFYILSVYAVFAGSIVELFSGPRFPKETMGPLTATLAVGVSLCMLVMLLSNILIGLKRPGAPAIITVIMLISEVAMIFIVGRATGLILYAAVAFDISVFIGFAFLVYYLSEKMGLRWPWKSLPRPMAAAVFSAILLSLLPTRGTFFLLGVAVSFPCYFVVLGLLGGFETSDFDMARETVGSFGKIGKLASTIFTFAQKAFSISPLHKNDGGLT